LAGSVSTRKSIERQVFDAEFAGVRMTMRAIQRQRGGSMRASVSGRGHARSIHDDGDVPRQRGLGLRT